MFDMYPAVLKWTPYEQKDKFFKKNVETFDVTDVIGYYCKNCDTVYAEFTHMVIDADEYKKTISF